MGEWLRGKVKPWGRDFSLRRAVFGLAGPTLTYLNRFDSTASYGQVAPWPVPPQVAVGSVALKNLLILPVYCPPRFVVYFGGNPGCDLLVEFISGNLRTKTPSNRTGKCRRTSAECSDRNTNPRVPKPPKSAELRLTTLAGF